MGVTNITDGQNVNGRRLESRRRPSINLLNVDWQFVSFL